MNEILKTFLIHAGRNFSDILTVLHAVEVGSVEGALLDMYVVASRPDLMTKDSPLMVKTVIQNPSTYGIELSGHAKKLRKPFLQYLHNNAALVSKILEEYTNPVKVIICSYESISIIPTGFKHSFVNLNQCIDLGQG